MQSEWRVEVEAAQEPKPERLLAEATVNGVAGFRVWVDAAGTVYCVFPSKEVPSPRRFVDCPKALALVGGKFGTGATVQALKAAVVAAWQGRA